MVYKDTKEIVNLEYGSRKNFNHFSVLKRTKELKQTFSSPFKEFHLQKRFWNDGHQGLGNIPHMVHQIKDFVENLIEIKIHFFFFCFCRTIIML